MKRLISTKGLHDGHFNAPWISTAIHERVDNKLTHCYKQDYGEDIVIAPTLSYELSEGVVMTLELAYTIDNPTPQRLENFREACENFYELYGFMVENENGTSRVLFRAIDIFDMASFIHALDYQSVSLEGVICAVDDGLTEKDAIYSPSGSYLIQIPNIPHYRIKEGTLYISPMAARRCTELQKLDIPVEMLFDNGSLREYPQGLKVKIWDTHYDGTPIEEEDDFNDDMPIFDDHEVGYSKDGKILIGCRYTFNDIRYEVPDGVEEIEDFAFLACRHNVELSIPRSVKKIGDYIFGNGGVINIRDE